MITETNITPVESPRAPKALGAYSQAILAKDFLFVSGQLPIDPETGKIESIDIEGQTRQVLKNIQAILEEAGLRVDDVVRTEIFLQDMADFKMVGAIYAETFCRPIKPARQTIQVAALPLNAKIEISCIALKKKLG